MVRWRRFGTRGFKLLLAVVVLLVAVRAVLPIVIERYANQTLDELEGYSGHIEDVDLALIRGAYVIEGVRIVKTGGKVPVPFFSASEIDLSVQWKALLDGAVVAEIDVHRPKLNFVAAADDASKAQEKAQEQLEPSDNWTEVVKDLTPFNINRFSIIDGEVHYRDFDAKPQVDIYVQGLNAEARNLTNSEDRSGSLVASFDGRATAMGSGRIRFDGRVDPYAKQPTFDFDFKLNDLELKQLNPYFRAYAKMDVEKGTFSMDGEFAASKGRFEGYVKPFVENLDVLRWEKEGESLPNKVWQAVLDAASELLEDQSKDQAATRIPFKGTLENPDIDVWSAAGNLLRHAFIEALRRGLEGSVDLQKVAGQDGGSEKVGTDPDDEEGKEGKNETEQEE